MSTDEKLSQAKNEIKSLYLSFPRARPPARSPPPPFNPPSPVRHMASQPFILKSIVNFPSDLPVYSENQFYPLTAQTYRTPLGSKFYLNSIKMSSKT